MLSKFDTIYVQDALVFDEKSFDAVSEVMDKDIDIFFNKYGGKSFNNGIYRIISLSDVLYWNNLVLDGFPELRGRLTCFGIDWLGRIFALDSLRNENGQYGVIMVEPGTAEILEVPCNIYSFHESELVEFQEEALAKSFYQRWLLSGGTVPQMHQCIGYKTPLFLGGTDTITNLELSDLDVYWTICGQLIQKTKDLPLAIPTKIEIS